MSQFMPAVFTNTFSQTYVDLLTNIKPHDVRSDQTDSEQGSPQALRKLQPHSELREKAEQAT